MAVNLPEYGVKAVVQDGDKFLKTIDAINKKVSDGSKQLNSSTSGANSFAKAFETMSGKLGGFGERISDVTGKLGGARQNIASFFAEFPPGTGAIAAAGAAAAAAATAFVGLGMRGASLTGIADSFDRLTRSIGVNGVQVLEDLRGAARGAVTDFALLQQANIALSGATGEFGRQFGESLPQLLRIAQAQANATGQDVTFLFQSLVTGVKRASPLLIDNTGLTLSVTEANERYAASIGKTVQQLTQEERQLALLQATLAAGNTAIAAFGDQQETAADKLGRLNATFNNVLDTLAIGVQPAFTQFLDTINRVLGFVQTLTTAITPLISTFLTLGATLINEPLNAFLSLIDPVVQFTAFLIRLTTVLVQPVVNAFNAVVQVINRFVTGIIKFLGEAIQNNLGLNFETLALNLGRGAGAAFGVFAAAIIEVANRLIFPAVITIAQFIADFLIGQSPPPKGPLSLIDQGGANLMSAYLDGITGVSLQPVEQVAASVSAALGSIGAATLPAVEARLAQLDRALQPFKNQLEIVKSRFEELSAPAEAALSAIDRQIAAANEALLRGEAGAADRVRALDEQRASIQSALDLQQQQVDSAQIQLALAEAQQARERALLNIRKQQLGAVEKVKEAAEPKTTKGAGGANDAPAEAIPGAGGGAGLSEFPSVLDLIGGQAAINQTAADLGQGFTEGIVSSIGSTIGTAGLDELQANQSALGEQLNRIGQADIGATFGNKLTELGNVFSTKFAEIGTTISNFISTLIDPANPESLPARLAELPGAAGAVLGSFAAILTENLQTPFENVINGLAESARNFFAGTGEGSISSLLNTAVSEFATLPTRIGTSITTLGQSFFIGIVTPFVAGVNAIFDAIEQLVNGALTGVREALAGFQGIADFAGQGDSFSNLLNSLSAGLEITPIPMPPLPGSRTGGIWGPGALRVHRGEEVISTPASSRLSVFPANVVQSLESLNRVLAQPMPISVPAGGSNTYNNQNDNSINANFYGDNDRRGVMQQLTTLRAMQS